LKEKGGAKNGDRHCLAAKDGDGAKNSDYLKKRGVCLKEKGGAKNGDRRRFGG
jgi:hypothetical protein